MDRGESLQNVTKQGLVMENVSITNKQQLVYGCTHITISPTMVQGNNIFFKKMFKMPERGSLPS